MKVIGDPQATNDDGSRVELRFQREQGYFATVHNDCIHDYSLKKSAGAVDLLHLVLRGPSGSGIAALHEDALVDMWHYSPQDGGALLGTIRAEHVVAGLDETGEYLKLQGRSACGHLIDEALSLEYSGGLRELIAAVAPGEIDASDAVPNSHIEAYFSSPSTFGALRLLASTMGLVLRDQGRQFGVRTRKEAIEQIRARAPVKLTNDDTLTSRFSRGSPIRERQ